MEEQELSDDGLAKFEGDMARRADSWTNRHALAFSGDGYTANKNPKDRSHCT